MSGPSSEALIYDAIRTPRGRGKSSGSLHTIKPVSLVVGLIDELRARHPGLDPAAIDDIVLGIVTPVGDQGSVLPRTAALAAGLPDTVAGLQLNRFCGSGLEAVNTSAQKVRSGWDDLIIAGGVESMSRCPLGADGGAWFNDPATNLATSFIPQGVSADLIATIEGFSRADVDRYAVQSQQRAAAAWSGGYFEKSIVPVADQNGVVVLDRDEYMRPESTVASLGALKPSFLAMGQQGGFDAVALQSYHWVERIDHVHHAGNSSGIVDGAALMRRSAPAADVVDRMVDEFDRGGRAAGAGFYEYRDGRKVGLWPGLKDAFGGDNISVPLIDMQERMLFAEAIDTVRCLDEGVLRSVADANVGSIIGIGFPAWTGGVLQYINQYDGGLPGFVARATTLADRYGERFTPPESLVDRAATGQEYL